MFDVRIRIRQTRTSNTEHRTSNIEPPVITLSLHPLRYTLSPPMSILVNSSTKVICQGITGEAGAFHTKNCLEYGTKMVGGVTPGKGGRKDANGLPIFDTVEMSVKETGANATMI